MKDQLRTIWNDKYGSLIWFLFLIMFGGIYLYFSRPSVTEQQDLHEVNGTLRTVDQVLVYGHKINKTERDSTYYIYPNEYPAAFQVSYHSYDRTRFYLNSRKNDISNYTFLLRILKN